jgi:hypothetical protein
MRTSELKEVRDDCLYSLVMAVRASFSTNKELAMPVAFQTTNISFANVQGKQTKTETVQFQKAVQSAETAVRGFNFDFRTGDHHIDMVQVSTRVKRKGADDVEVEATVLYADKDKQDDFSGNVNVLVIAEVT